jgi:formamidopyrimidine-DNA glycosylase
MPPLPFETVRLLLKPLHDATSPNGSEGHMPELPEAEIARRTLTPWVVGRTIEQVVLRMPSRVKRPHGLSREEADREVARFVAALQERTVESVERCGKDLLFRLDDGDALAFNFGLWASVTLRSRLEGGQPEGCPPIKRLGLALRLGSANERVDDEVRWLVFADIIFSTYGVQPFAPAPVPPPYDALDPGLDGPLLARLAAQAKPGKAKAATAKPASPQPGATPRAATRPGPAPQAKRFLMDDTCMLGIGNGYADEILWLARINPLRPVTELDEGGWRSLADAVRAVLDDAIARGGELGFLDARCRRGRVERRIHHRAGEPCPRCGTPLAGYTKSGRETDHCPVCQPLS